MGERFSPPFAGSAKAEPITANLTAADLAQMSDRDLRKLELQIARKHSGMMPWGIVLWAFLNLAVWLSLWPLVLTGVLPLWLGFGIATINMTLVYLPTHDAQHHIIGRPGTKWHWLNELTGHATSWMILTPFEVWRITHMDHHRHTNDSELDVDITSHADTAWGAIWDSVKQRQPLSKRQDDYAASVTRAGREDLLGLAALYKIVYFGFLFAMAWSGFALEAFFLWWLPFNIAITYLVFFLSWAPHSPGMGQGRYKDTKNWRSSLGNILSMGMQYHIVHHLHPYIPLMRTGAAYWEMKPILEARGCNIEM